jgi:hypothetical protein
VAGGRRVQFAGVNNCDLLVVIHRQFARVGNGAPAALRASEERSHADRRQFASVGNGAPTIGGTMSETRSSFREERRRRRIRAPCASEQAKKGPIRRGVPDRPVSCWGRRVGWRRGGLRGQNRLAPQLGNRVPLDLADTFGGNAPEGTDVCELGLPAVDQPVAPTDNVGRPLVESRQHGL